MPSMKKDIQKQIEGWKNEGKVVLMMVFDDGREGYFAQPTRNQLKLIYGKVKTGGPVAMTTAFIRNCFLGGGVTKE